MWWITIYVGSRKGVKKTYIFFKKIKKSVSNILYISIYLSMKNLFETIRVKRERERER